MDAARVIVVGTGPAGVRAAETLVRAGLRPIVLDEGRSDGGRIYLRQPAQFTRTYEQLYGTEAGAARALHASFESLRGAIDFRPETLAWNLVERRLYAHRAGRSETLPFDALIVCAGATDRLLPLPGWELPGVYSLGGAQIALKSQACAIGRRVALVGTGPLLYLLASQYVQAGAGLAAVLDTSRWSQRIGALGALLAGRGTLLKGAGLEFALRRAGVRVQRGVQQIEICGDPTGGVAGLAWRDARGTARRIECDAVALGFHLRPETQLADLARCEFAFDAATQLWLPRIDAEGRSSVAGIYLAGDGARVRGARAAELSGALAAAAALADLGLSPAPMPRAAMLGELRRLERFAAGLARAFPFPAQLAAGADDATVVCRCEVITAGELRSACTEGGAREPNRAKAFTRVGMGRCQGRYCGDASAAIVAAATGSSREAVGRLRSQAPVKPIPIATDATP
ncbi:MAG: FAD/NAD(P)-binding oxidoreductase [Steroidobacteraceae bacterium]